jgi:DNA invertase Pin-like site-specific DNA recombinase
VKFIGYRRVSTSGQVDRYGLPAQEADLRAYARAGRHQLARIETDDAKSGTLPADERPGLLAALKAVRAGEADGLLVPGDLDRLARELIVQEAILSQVWNAGGVVHATTRGEIEPDDPDDPMRTAIRQFMGIFAELDRALIAKRMRNGRKAKAAAGGYAGYGSPAFGQRSDGGELVADEREAAVIARMRELRADGLSYERIAARLDAEGLRPKRGGSWHPQTVSRVLGRGALPYRRARSSSGRGRAVPGPDPGLF